MASCPAGGVGAATGVVVENVVVNGVPEAERVSGEGDEDKGVNRVVSVPPAPRTTRPKATDALTRASASDVLRMVRPERRGAPERWSMLCPPSV
jgi:hypothetical protein